jgi:hypothetical protein
MTLLCCEIPRSANCLQSGKIFQGRLWLKNGCFANDDDADDVRK